MAADGDLLFSAFQQLVGWKFVRVDGAVRSLKQLVQLFVQELCDKDVPVGFEALAGVKGVVVIRQVELVH